MTVSIIISLSLSLMYVYAHTNVHAAIESDTPSRNGANSPPHHHTLSTVTDSGSPCSNCDATANAEQNEGKKMQISQGAEGKLVINCTIMV